MEDPCKNFPDELVDQPYRCSVWKKEIKICGIVVLLMFARLDALCQEKFNVKLLNCITLK